jgi:hypothetical protein
MIDAGDLLGCHSWVPRTREECSEDIELLGAVEESLGEGDGLMLVFLLTARLIIVKWRGKVVRTAPYPAMNRI